MHFFILLAVLISIVIVLFAVQNAGLATITFLTFHFEGSLAFILVVVFALGILSGMLVTVPSFWKMSARLRGQKRKVRALEEHEGVRKTSESSEHELPAD
jgi:lipopolysaccharide assembly protein A